MLAYVLTPHHEGPEVDRMMVENDVKALFKAGEKRLGTDEKTFIRIFSERSRAHLAAVNSAYHSMYGKPLTKVHPIYAAIFFFRFLFFHGCLVVVQRVA